MKWGCWNWSKGFQEAYPFSCKYPNSTVQAIPVFNPFNFSTVFLQLHLQTNLLSQHCQQIQQIKASNQHSNVWMQQMCPHSYNPNPSFKIYSSPVHLTGIDLQNLSTPIPYLKNLHLFIQKRQAKQQVYYTLTVSKGWPTMTVATPASKPTTYSL